MYSEEQVDAASRATDRWREEARRDRRRGPRRRGQDAQQRRQTSGVTPCDRHELGIPDTIHRRGGSATVPELVAELSLPPSKATYLRRLMRLLAHAGFFAVAADTSSYGLTALSRLLVSAPGARQGLSPFALAMLHPIVVSPSMSLASWFRAADDAAAPVAFAAAHGRELWAVAKDTPEFGVAFNDAMVCDGRFVMDALMHGRGGDLFRGISSLVDVGGGSGGAAKAITAAFPYVRCSILELLQVVETVPSGDGGVEFVVGEARLGSVSMRAAVL